MEQQLIETQLDEIQDALNLEALDFSDELNIFENNETGAAYVTPKDRWIEADKLAKLQLEEGELTVTRTSKEDEDLDRSQVTAVTEQARNRTLD